MLMNVSKKMSTSILLITVRFPWPDSAVLTGGTVFLFGYNFYIRGYLIDFKTVVIYVQKIYWTYFLVIRIDFQ